MYEVIAICIIGASLWLLSGAIHMQFANSKIAETGGVALSSNEKRFFIALGPAGILFILAMFLFIDLFE